MPFAHLRDLAKFGVICDIDPYDLPDSAWSFGVNIRFRNGKITGAPVFRNAFTLGTADPRYSVAASPVAGLDLLFTGYKNGRVWKFNGTETDYSITGYANTSAEALWTSTTLANVLYVNRADRAPWYLRSSDARFQNLGVASPTVNDWSAAWTTQVLRACGGALVALNVTKGATNYPQMVKTSSIPLSGVIPTSWDTTVANTLATENILAEMKGPITDGQTLGNTLVIYGLQEAWLMQADQSIEVYNYRKLPFQKGSINANCSYERDGKHFVFGVDDIWMHDSNSALSIVDKKNRDFIFGSLNLSKRDRFFINANPQLNELQFCYVSGDRAVSFLGGNGCNRAATLNLSDMTWTFDDLPLVFSASNANLSVSVTYATTTATYDTTGGTYQDQEDGFKRTPVFVGEVNAAFGLGNTLYAYDLFGQGSTVSFPVDAAASCPRILEREGIDLDSLNADLRGYKVLSSLYPQGRLGVGSAPLEFSVGATDYSNVPVTYSDYQPFDGAENYKLDFNVAGRFLAMKIRHDDFREMSLSGFDLDLIAGGQR